MSSKKVPSRQCHPGFSPIPRLLVTCLDEANHKQKLSDGSCQIIDNRTKLLVNDTWNVNITIASKTSLVKQGGMNTNKINTVRISLCVKAVFLYERAWSKVKKVVVFIRKFFTVSLKKNDYTNLINTNRFNTAGLALRCFVYAFNSSSSSSNMITCSKSVIFSCLRCPSSNSLPSLQKKRNSSLKKGHNFQRWYILTCWDTSCFRLRLKYWSVKKSLNHLSKWMKKDLHRSSNSFPVTAPPFSGKKQIALKIWRGIWPTTTGAILSILFNSNEQRRGRFRVLLCLFLCKLIVSLQFLV